MTNCGVVIIGRNEGERLRRALTAVEGWRDTAIYVDSGSKDSSVELAESLGFAVLELDPAKPFSAARGRNEGFAALAARHADLDFVQFVDGDAELSPEWVRAGVEAMNAREDACAVFGRLHERSPKQSIFNRICELEWHMPIGEVHCFGGIAMLRAASFAAVGGFDTTIVAGEEPELSQRLLQKGWVILSLDTDMASHDAAMEGFRQWWRRCARSGHAYAQVCWTGSGIRGRFGLRQSLRTWFWVIGVPAMAVMAWFLNPWAPALVVMVYIVQLFRIGLAMRRRGGDVALSIAYALLWFPSQVAQWLGQCRFLVTRLQRKEPLLMEHKTASS